MGDSGRSSRMGRGCGEERTMNIFAELIHSVYDFQGYAGFLENRKFKTFLYGLLLGLLYVLVAVVGPLAAVIVPAGGMERLMKDVVPDFALEDGQFWMEEPVEYSQYAGSQGGIYVKIDTDHPVTDEISNVDLLVFDKALIMDADNMIIKSEGEVIRTSFADLDFGDWTREEVLTELLPMIQMIMWMVVAIMILFCVIGFFLGALFTAGIGAIIGSVMKYSLSFGDLYKLAVHARTVPMLIMMALAWLPLYVPFPFLINFGISAVYLWRALLCMKRAQQEERQNAYWNGEV